MVIGLEVHCELATATKLFCGCPNMFGDEPNTNVCPACLGSARFAAGAQREAPSSYAMRIGAALNCTSCAVDVPPQELLLSRHAEGLSDHAVRPADQRRRLPRSARRHPRRHRPGAHRRGHGQDTHVGGDGRIHGAEYSLVDYNRAGVPLVEIVSEPDIRSADEAKRLCRRAAQDRARDRRVGRPHGRRLDAGHGGGGGRVLLHRHVGVDKRIDLLPCDPSDAPVATRMPRETR